LFAAMFMFGIGYTLKVDEHVRVDVFYDGYSPRTQAYINIFGAIYVILEQIQGLITQSLQKKTRKELL
jgi:TRAP-type mannitol/chloroaromatic compound transport system permease small subunit